MVRLTALCETGHFGDAWRLQRTCSSTIEGDDKDEVRRIALYRIFTAVFDGNDADEGRGRRSFSLRLLQTPLQADEERLLETYLTHGNSRYATLLVAFLVPRRRYVDAVRVITERHLTGQRAASLHKELRALLTPQERAAFLTATSSQASAQTPARPSALSFAISKATPVAKTPISTPKTPTQLAKSPAAATPAPVDEIDAMDIDAVPQRATPLHAPGRGLVSQSPFQRASASRLMRQQGVTRTTTSPSFTAASPARTPSVASPAAKSLVSSLLSLRVPASPAPASSITITSPLRNVVASPSKPQPVSAQTPSAVLSPSRLAPTAATPTLSTAKPRSLLVSFMGQAPAAGPISLEESDSEEIAESPQRAMSPRAPAKAIRYFSSLPFVRLFSSS